MNIATLTESVADAVMMIIDDDPRTLSIGAPKKIRHARSGLWLVASPLITAPGMLELIAAAGGFVGDASSPHLSDEELITLESEGDALEAVFRSFVVSGNSQDLLYMSETLAENVIDMGLRLLEKAVILCADLLAWESAERFLHEMMHDDSDREIKKMAAVAHLELQPRGDSALYFGVQEIVFANGRLQSANENAHLSMWVEIAGHTIAWGERVDSINLSEFLVSLWLAVTSKHCEEHGGVEITFDPGGVFKDLVRVGEESVVWNILDRDTEVLVHDPGRFVISRKEAESGVVCFLQTLKVARAFEDESLYKKWVSRRFPVGGMKLSKN